MRDASRVNVPASSCNVSLTCIWFGTGFIAFGSSGAAVTRTAPVRCGEATYLGPMQGSNVCEASVVEAVPLLLLIALAPASAWVRRAFAAVLRFALT